MGLDSVNSQGWPSNLGQDHVHIRYEINFSDGKEGSMVSSVICDRWQYLN